MKRIVHIIDNLTLGGAENLLLSTIKILPQFKHHVIILTPRIQIDEVEDVAELHCLHHNGWLSILDTVRKMRKLVNSIAPELVHSHLFLSSFITRLALGNKYRLFYSIHTIYSAAIFKKRHFILMEKLVFKKEHTVIGVSNYVLNDYKKTVTACTGGTVLYNFIDDAFLKKTSIKKVIPSVALHKWVAIGSLKTQKNYELIFDLFTRLYNQSGEKEKMSLEIYGDGTLRKELETKIKASGLPVYFNGNVKGIEFVLNQYDAYISASLYEGYGIAPMEALSVGLPIFLSNIPVYKEIYSDYAFFFEVDRSSEETFNTACESYLSMSLKDKATLLQESKEHAAKVANGTSYAQRLLEIYQLSK